MKTTWTTGVTKERAEEIRRDFESSLILRQRLITILAKKMDSERKQTRTKDSYDSPNWAYRQADCSGFERALEEVISLLS